MTIDSVVTCHVCHGSNLVPRRVLLEDLFGDVSEKAVRICKDCETIHYMQHGSVFYEFSVKINKEYRMQDVR